jgi:FtsP/CotA-like multicopper oxidase with cupredoxin domain
MKKENPSPGLSRRQLLKSGALLGTGLALGAQATAQGTEKQGHAAHGHGSSSKFGNAHLLNTVGDIAMDGQQPIDPFHYLTAFNDSEFPRHKDWYRETPLPDGTTLREYEIIAYDKEIEIAPGVYFPAWTYNGQVPGPTIRATEDDTIKIHFVNDGSHPHTIHFHGFHHSNMDGVFEIINPGDDFTYEFLADPVGLHLYHCHSIPLKRHIHKGLYGTYIVDPKQPRPEAHEMVMMMNGFDTNFDDDNEVYAVNSVAFHHMHHPIQVKLGQLIRFYLVNVLEFDLINSFHIHAHFFDVFRTGTRDISDQFTDTVHFVQGERAIIEMRFRFEGQFMFHAHQSEFAELGWMALFEVTK